MRAAVAEEDRALAKRYVASPRHTIEVDFHPYLRALARERKRRPSRTAVPARSGALQ